MAKKAKEPLVKPFCEYVFRNGHYELVAYHTHDGYYCSYYENSEAFRAQEGPIFKQAPTKVHKCATGAHRHFGVYEFVYNGDTISLPVFGDWHSDDDPFPEELIGYLKASCIARLNELGKALLAVGTLVKESKFSLKIAVTPQDLCLDDHDDDDHDDDVYRDLNGAGIYEFNELDDGRFTYLPVFGKCVAENPEETEKYFPTDLSAFLECHCQPVRKDVLESIGAMVLQASKVHLKIIVNSTFIDDCIEEGHLPNHGGV